MTESREPREPLKRKVLGGVAWLFGSYGLSKFGRIGMMLAIAALLSPRAYGLIGLSTVIITVAQIINEFGIWQAVVQRSDPDERFVNTAFAANVLGGLLVATGVFITAPWIANFYGEPQMAALLKIMGLALAVDGIIYVPDGLLRKEFKFKSRALPEIAGTFGGGVATIALVLLGFGVLSYAVGFVTESVTRCILTFQKVDWRPKLQVSWIYLKDIGAYARHILGGDLARHISSNIDYLIVGRILGAAPLGYYTLAFNLANYPVSNFAYILSRIAFPTFAALQEDTEYARRIYLRMIQTVAALVIPVLVMLALLANPLVTGLLGEKWQPAIFILQVMVVAGISRAISMPGSDMLRAIGFQRVPFRIYVLEGFVMLATLLLVAERGIEVVALATTAIMSVASWAITTATCRTFGIGLWALVQAFIPGAALAASGAAPVLLLRFLDMDLSSEILELAILGIAAAAGMTVCLATALRSFAREIIALVMSKKRG